MVSVSESPSPARSGPPGVLRWPLESTWKIERLPSKASTKFAWRDTGDGELYGRAGRSDATFGPGAPALGA